MRVTRNTSAVSFVTAGAVKMMRLGSLVSSVTAGPAVCVHVRVSPLAAAGHARTEALPPARTAWSPRATTDTAVVALTLMVAVAVRADPPASTNDTLKV